MNHEDDESVSKKGGRSQLRTQLHHESPHFENVREPESGPLPFLVS